MSFFKFLKKTFSGVDERIPRMDSNIRCGFKIFPQGKDLTPDDIIDLQRGTIINVTSRGVGLLTSPLLSLEEMETYRKSSHNIYLDFVNPETDQAEKLIGDIRWMKSVQDVQTPYTEIGIAIITMEDTQRNIVLSQLFDDAPTPPDKEDTGEKQGGKEA